MTLQQMKEARAELARKCRALLDSVPDNSKWSTENQTAYEALTTEIERVDGAIKREEKLAGVEASLANVDVPPAQAAELGISVDEATARRNLEGALFGAWARNRPQDINEEQRAALGKRYSATMSTTTGSEGGYTVDTILARRLVQAMADFGGMRQLAQVIVTAGGNQIDWPTTDATAEEGEIVGENVLVSEEDATFGTVASTVFKYSSKGVAVPIELLQDTSIDIEGHLRERLFGRIARYSNRHFTVGDGSGKPMGAITSAATVAGLTVSGLSYDDLIELEHSIDPSWRRMAGTGWQFHDNALKVLKKLKDGDGRPLWVPGLTSGEPDELLNYPYAINQHMAAPGASARSVGFGAWSSYLVRDAMDIVLLRMTDSAYSKKGQVGFLAFARCGGSLIAANDQSIKVLLHPAS